MQIEAMNTRLAAVEKSIGKPGGDAVPEPIQIDPERSITCPDLTVECVLASINELSLHPVGSTTHLPVVTMQQLGVEMMR